MSGDPDRVRLDVDAITFDHYMTLKYSTKNDKEDIIYPILRSLKRQTQVDEEAFIERYLEFDRLYRLDLEATNHELILDDLIIFALHELGHDGPKTMEAVTSSVNEALAQYRTNWYDDTELTLCRLREEGYRIGLISNTHWRWLPETFLEMRSCFDAITLSYIHGYAKPNPSIFHATLSKLNVKPGRCLHVGDDPCADVWGARNAGLKTAYLKRNELDTDADVTIQQLSDLFRYLEK
jgi:HAD superfamily hydrolase (TIGR01549 family)